MSPHPPSPSDAGLSATGAALLATLLTCAGVLVDIVVSRGLHWGFTAGFVVACAWVATRVEGRHLLAAVTIPPWVFVIGVLLAQQVLGLSGSGSWLLREATDTSTKLALNAPLLLGGEALAAAIALTRLVRRRRADARIGSGGRRSPVSNAPNEASRPAAGSWTAAENEKNDGEQAKPDEPWLF